MSLGSLIEFQLWTKGDWPHRDVVGESFHEAAIRSLFPKQIGQDHEVFLTASLIPEPTNKWDRHAVKVVVKGQHVGYLSKEDAPNYQPMLAALVAHGMLPVTKCRIYGSEYDEWIGTDRRGRDITRQTFSSSVSLTLDEPYLCVPVNLPPRVPHTVLPHGQAVQVRKEENHQDVLRRYVGQHGEVWAYGTLHTVVDQTTKVAKELIEIRIDNERIGDLTPAMSLAYLPIVTQLAERGRAAAVKVIVKGNQIQAEVVLHASKARELDTAWLSTNLGAGMDTQHSMAAGQVSLSAAPPHQTDAHQPVPAKPTRIRFYTPPGWPPAPEGWEPPPGWQPDPSWPHAPGNWVFWRAED